VECSINTEASVRIFSRTEELESLRRRFTGPRSTLVHGPAGVGKTLLLHHLIREFDNVLYCPASPSPQVVFRSLAAALAARNDATLARLCPGQPDSLAARSAVALKGLVCDALRATSYRIVLDHLVRPSAAFAAMASELMVSCSTPLVAVARSAHMEDAGYLARLLPDRSERLALRNFDPDTARAFAVESARDQHLSAANLSTVLDGVVKSSQGNPGAILRMVALAAHARYRSGNQIKFAPLYVDFLMESAASNAV
jgi:DNA polymerase III delta prime subunit